ncbi:MAG: cation:dicarboxylase symporter family transporter, partial [Rickettsiales bacterium]|nr:cation:dicarboxylase symporter family transporter [Rickettsiales bacterium]
MSPKKSKKKKPFYRGLFFQVIAAIVIGAVFGYVSPDNAVEMKPLGDGFIKLIKMLIAPIIFCTMVSGIAGMGDMKQVGRVGAKAILMFEIITTLALIIGIVLVEILKPGLNMHIDVASIDTSAIAGKVDAVKPHSTVDFFMNMIPHTIFSPFTEGEILQVLLVALLFASALSKLGDRGRPVVEMIDSFSHVLFKLVDIITLAAPIGAFGAMAYTVGKFGVGSLRELGELIFIFYLTGAVFIFLVIGPIMTYYCKLSTMQFIKYIREELLIVLGTSSSESVLPTIMEKLVALGCSKPVVGLVIPASYSFNLVGSSIYFTMGALFIVNATGTTITFAQEMTLLGVLLITS